MPNLEQIRQAGLAAQRSGTPWHSNPYPSGSVEAYEWDVGHTAGRRTAHMVHHA